MHEKQVLYWQTFASYTLYKLAMKVISESENLLITAYRHGVWKKHEININKILADETNQKQKQNYEVLGSPTI